LRIVLNIVGLILALFGTLWILQGFNILTQGFMAGQTKWAIIGFVVLGFAVIIFFQANRKKKA